MVTLSNHRAGRCCTASAEMTKSNTKLRRNSAEAKRFIDNLGLDIQESYDFVRGKYEKHARQIEYIHWRMNMNIFTDVLGG